MGHTVLIFTGKGSRQKTIELFLFRCNCFFELCSFDVMQKLFFIQTKLGETVLTWYKQQSFDGYSEFVSKITQRIVNPDREQVNISRLNGLRYRNNHYKYIEEFRELIDATSERKLSNNVYSFLRLLTEKMRRDLFSNEQNLSIIEYLYKAFVRF
jgi:uncharacterized protein YwgA